MEIIKPLCPFFDKNMKSFTSCLASNGKEYCKDRCVSFSECVIFNKKIRDIITEYESTASILLKELSNRDIIQTSSSRLDGLLNTLLIVLNSEPAVLEEIKKHDWGKPDDVDVVNKLVDYTNSLGENGELSDEEVNILIDAIYNSPPIDNSLDEIDRYLYLKDIRSKDILTDKEIDDIMTSSSTGEWSYLQNKMSEYNTKKIIKEVNYV